MNQELWKWSSWLCLSNLKIGAKLCSDHILTIKFWFHVRLCYTIKRRSTIQRFVCECKQLPNQNMNIQPTRTGIWCYHSLGTAQGNWIRIWHGRISTNQCDSVPELRGEYLSRDELQLLFYSFYTWDTPATLRFLPPVRAQMWNKTDQLRPKSHIGFTVM